MSTVLAIDPGPTQSAWLELVDGQPARFGIQPNEWVVDCLRQGLLTSPASTVVIEQIRSFGMAVGAEVFDTVHWSGRFHEAASHVPVVLLPRIEVKKALCHDSRAKDANIRQALLDRFGGKATAVGTIRARGPLYGIANDAWSALALAVTYAEAHP